MAEPIDQETLAAAIVRAKGLMEKAIKSSTNPHFRSSYADYGAVLDATMPALQQCGLSVEQITGWHNEEYCLLTWMQHKSGAKGPISYWPILWAPDKPQPMGSSLTYGKRYQHGLVCGIATEADDDGNAATNVPRGTSAYASRKTGFYPLAETAIRNQPSLESLKQWWADNQDEIRALSPKWIEHLEGEKDRRKQTLIDEMSEDTELREQLKGSLKE